MGKSENRLLRWLSKKWWTGIAAIVAIIAVVVAIIIGNKKLPEMVQEDSNHSQVESPNDSTNQTISEISISRTLETYYGTGIACKGDSIRAWNEAYQRAKNNLSENLKDEKINIANASIDFSQSVKPILTQNGWEATVVVFVKK